MLDHLIVTIYGYELSIHRLIQLIDHCFFGDCGKCLGWSVDGRIHSIGDHCMVLIIGTVIRGCGLGVIRD
jgi:hypothetical protein